jgi:hypothetical protein
VRLDRPKGKKKPKTRHGEGACGGAWYGAFWGMLFGLLFFVPFLGAALGGAVGAAFLRFSFVWRAWWHTIDTRSRTQVSPAIPHWIPGNSPWYGMVLAPRLVASGIGVVPHAEGYYRGVACELAPWQK